MPCGYIYITTFLIIQNRTAFIRVSAKAIFVHFFSPQTLTPTSPGKPEKKDSFYMRNEPISNITIAVIHVGRRSERRGNLLHRARNPTSSLDNKMSTKFQKSETKPFCPFRLL